MLAAPLNAGPEWQAKQKKDGYEIAVVPCDLADFEATKSAVDNPKPWKTAKQG